MPWATTGLEDTNTIILRRKITYFYVNVTTILNPDPNKKLTFKNYRGVQRPNAKVASVCNGNITSLKCWFKPWPWEIQVWYNLDSSTVWSVCPLARQSVGPSVRQSVSPSVSQSVSPVKLLYITVLLQIISSLSKMSQTPTTTTTTTKWVLVQVASSQSHGKKLCYGF